MKYFLLLLLCVFAISCGKDEESNTNSNLAMTKSYEHKEYGALWTLKCTTGNHSFNSQTSQEDVLNQYCRALQDNKLNNNCGLSMRYEAFEKDCMKKGQSWQPF